jgi:hypothetical protein
MWLPAALAIAAAAIAVVALTAEDEVAVTCLLKAYNERHYAFTENSATVERLGCFLLPAAPVPTFIVNESGLTDADVTRCAAVCQLREAGSKKAQFLFQDSRCACIPRVSYIYATSAFNSTECCHGTSPTIPAATSPRYCSQGFGYGAVFELDLLCPLNSTLCHDLKYCEMRDGCCAAVIEAPSGDSDLNSGSLLLAQWAGGFIIIAGVGHASYLIAARRHRRLAEAEEPLNLQDRHERRLVLPGTEATAESILLIGLNDIAGVTERCVALYDTTREVDPENSCTICLEEFGSSNVTTSETPCKHVFHRKCLEDFVKHKLSTSLESITCPMCRAPILNQVMDDDSPLGQLRQTIVEMREGTTRRVPRLTVPTRNEDAPPVPLPTNRPRRRGRRTRPAVNAAVDAGEEMWGEERELQQLEPTHPLSVESQPPRDLDDRPLPIDDVSLDEML